MARDDVHVAFARTAARDGIELVPQTFDWLCEQGHVGLERVAKARRDATLVVPVTAALDTLNAIFARLGGDVSVLHASRENLLLGVDLVHVPTATLIEVDAPAHFTSFRLGTLERYPADFAGFDVAQYMEHCRCSSSKTDGLERGLATKAFGFGGGPRERAYHDALRDLATAAMGHPPLLRFAALDGDGEGAYRRNRDRMLALRDS